MRSVRPAICMAVLVMLSACAVTPQDYAGGQPAFSLQSFFDGPLVAEGIFQNRAGKSISRFRVHMLGSWRGNEGRLDELFTYRDGMPQQGRIWRLQQLDEQRFEGTADGSAGPVVGKATGEAQGFALHWDYRVDLPVGERTVRVHFDDWMWRLDRDTVINRSIVSKLGVRVGEATLVIRRLPDTPENRALVLTYPQFDDGG